MSRRKHGSTVQISFRPKPHGRPAASIFGYRFVIGPGPTASVPASPPSTGA